MGILGGIGWCWVVLGANGCRKKKWNYGSYYLELVELSQ